MHTFKTDARSSHHVRSACPTYDGTCGITASSTMAAVCLPSGCLDLRLLRTEVSLMVYHSGMLPNRLEAAIA